MFIFCTASNKNLFINLPEISGNITIIIKNLQGQINYLSEQKNATNLEIDMSLFITGIYILQLERDDEIIVKKIIKE